MALEIITKAEIAQHFKKSMMPRSVANVFQIVVLPPRTHAALRARRPGIGTLVMAEKHVLELHHAGVGKQQRRIAPRNERTRWHDRMAVRLEEFKKFLPDFAAFHIGFKRRRLTEWQLPNMGVEYVNSSSSDSSSSLNFRTPHSPRFTLYR